MADERDMTVADVAGPLLGMQLGKEPIIIHGKEACAGEFCPFHNPSDHRLKDARINIRFDRSALVERICEHGVGHADPDSVAYFERKGITHMGVHGCDGCC